MKNITVIGSGTMGSGIAHCFAQYGFSVVLIDRVQAPLDKAKEQIAINMERQCKKGLMTMDQKSDALDRITYTIDFETGVAQADLIVEAASENEKIKQAIFEQLDRHTSSNCILATNTSSLSITTLASHTHRSDKVIGMHFMNPVPLMPLVEIIKGHHTSEKTLALIIELTHAIEKTPLIVADYPGFVANRILLPMINEAIEALFQGVGDVTSIDQIMKLGMGHPMGPLRLADFIGLDVCLSILNVLHHGFGKEKYVPCPLLKKMVQAGNLGVKSKRGFYDYSENPKAPIPVDFSLSN